MDQKAGKTFLPQTYQQFLAQKKKMVRQVTVNKAIQPQLQEFKQNKSIKINTKVEDEDYDSEDTSKNAKETIIIEKVVYSEYKKMFDEFQDNKFEAIKQRIESELQKLKKQLPIEVSPVNHILNNIEIQSLQNIAILKEEFKNLPGKRNLDLLEEILRFNKFFVILNKQKRWKICDACFFEERSPGEKIYEEGQLDDFMYVIVKGCVKQYQKKITSFNQKMTVNFISHYEGSNFGEVQALGENQKRGKRYHSTETTEKTYLLKIQNNFYKQLISNSAEDDFEKKLNSLMESSIFKETSKMMVTPLLSTLDKHILPYGEVLVRQGDQVKKLYFVAEGNLQVLLLDRTKRNIKHFNIEEKLDNIYLKKPQTKQTNRTKTKSYSIHNTFYYPETTETNKEFIYGNKKLIGEEVQYNDQIIFADLRVGDFFGGKSFLSHLDKQKKEESSKYFEKSLKAKLSIISSSTQSIVYSLDEKKFFSLSDNLQKLIILGIIENSYFDEYDIETKANGQREWKKYSEKLVENVIKSKKDRNHSFRK